MLYPLHELRLRYAGISRRSVPDHGSDLHDWLERHLRHWTEHGRCSQAFGQRQLIRQSPGGAIRAAPPAPMAVHDRYRPSFHLPPKLRKLKPPMVDCITPIESLEDFLQGTPKD